MVFALLAGAQTAVVIPISVTEARELSAKYVAFEKARTAWESVRDAAVKKYGTGDTPCGLEFSGDFMSAVPKPCPLSHPTWITTDTTTNWR